MKTVYAVGLGPGSLALLTPEAREVIGHCDTIAGYKTYLEQIPELLAGKRIIANGMRQEVDRCRAALEAANAGAEVAVISSGDAGIYGMAGLLLELAESEEFRGIEIRVVPGVELTSSDEDHNIIHMLGYHFRYDDRELNRTLREVSMWRARRNDALLTALREMGIYVTIDELLAVNEGRFIGKPTIAEVMVAKGYVKSVEEAFQTVFRRDEIRAVPKQMIATEKAVDLIHGAGGIAVLAHPMEIRRRGEKLSDFRNRFETVFRRVIRHGIDGMECYHPSATLLQAEELRTLARKNNLIITKGSDFHSDKARRQYEN